MTTHLRTLHRTIDAVVIEASAGRTGPAALLCWADAFGSAVVAAHAPWSSPAAAALAVLEPGSRIIVRGVIAETERRPWLPGETLVMAVEAIQAAPAKRQRKARQ